MKKTILIILLALILTGCDATYKVTIEEDKINDDIKIYTNSSDVSNANQQTIDKFNNQIMDWERGYEHYKREMYTTDTVTGYEYTYDFTYEEYDAMSELRKCYDEFNFTYNSKEVSLNTSNEFLCHTYYPDVKNLTITIKTDYKVLTSNADSSKGNEYTWVVNSNNYKNKPITLKIDKTQKVKLDEEEKNPIDIKMILVTILFVLLILVLIVNKKKVA